MLMIFLADLETEEERSRMAELHEESKKLLKYIAYQITRNDEMAEDALQDTFLAAIRHKEKIFSFSCRDFRAWSVITISPSFPHKRAKALQIQETIFWWVTTKYQFSK